MPVPTSGSIIPDSCAAVTPNNSGALNPNCVALYVGGAGDVTVDMRGAGSNVALVGVVAGTVVPGRFTRVYATGTTATNIVEFYVS